MEAIDLIPDIVNAWAPPPPLTLSEWADTYRQVSSGPFPGRWKTDRTPYLREILDCVTNPEVNMIVIMKPTRVGGTEVINNAIGYFMHYDPCDILYVQTSLDEGRKYSENILRPMLENTPVLNALVRKDRGRKATTTKLHKSYPGGALDIVGAKSPKGFRMLSKRVAVCDDVDGYDSNPEGDPIRLAIGRTKDFWNSVNILSSSPTTDGVSRIQSYYEQSDKRRRYVPCPRCDKFQVLKFGGRDEEHGIKWDDDTGEIWYECEHCHGKILEHEKIEMDRRGEYRAEGESEGIAGFHINPFLCAWHPWHKFRTEFLDCKGDPNKLMVFINQSLGEVWKDKRNEKIEPGMLYERRETYPADIPATGLIVVAGVDVQDKRLEVEVRAYGEGYESWGIEHKIIQGSPAEQKTWDMLDEFLWRTYKHESGILMPIKSVGIDIGGHFTSQVYEFCKHREYRGIYAVKGSTKRDADILDGKPSTKNAVGAKLYHIGVSTCKDMLIGRLVIRSGAGAMHWSMSYDREFFEQYLAEKCITTRDGKTRWIPLPGKPNEAIDLHSYCLGALYIYGPDWNLLKNNLGQDMTRKIFKGHTIARHQDVGIELRPDLPIIIGAGFNTNPLVWELCQSDGKRVWVFDELAFRNGDTAMMCREFMRRYGKHGKGVIVYGSAIGSVRAGAGKTHYAILREYGLTNTVYRKVNPLQIDRIGAINNMIEDISGRERLTYSPRCVMLKNDFEASIWDDENGDIDRTEFGRGMAVDALSFYVHYVYAPTAYQPSQKRFYK